ncbi:MAG: hypothetical protein IKH51_11650 [Clostridia bacterium]|nr:hypothetical protein [Clostridia bacterium]
MKGVGPAKAKLLLSHFGTLSALKAATVEELKTVKGINSETAENIVKYFKKDKI